jgi:hypothetical protein
MRGNAFRAKPGVDLQWFLWLVDSRVSVDSNRARTTSTYLLAYHHRRGSKPGSFEILLTTMNFDVLVACHYRACRG